MAKSKKRRKVVVFSVIGLVLVALTLTAIFRNKQAVITVQTAKVTRRNITETVVANGRIYPVVQVHISPEVSGEIIELPVKEGQFVHKGDLLLKIKPDFYTAALNQSEANYESSLAGKAQAQANLEKATADYQRNTELYNEHLIPESDFIGYKAAYDVAKAQVETASDQVNMAKASVDSAKDSLAKTTIVSPLDGTITKLNSQLGERVLGTVQNAGTDIMTISDLNNMEARVDVGEMDVVLMKRGLKAKLEVDAYKNRKFSGVITAIANSSEGLSAATSSSQEATKFEVRIAVNEKDAFRPGMSVTAEIETRYRTNVLAVPIASVTGRVPKQEKPKPNLAMDPPTNNSTPSGSGQTNSASSGTGETNAELAGTGGTNAAAANRKSDEEKKPVDVVFAVEGDHVKMVPVKIGISDDSYWEITDGLTQNEEIVSGGFRAISHDLQDGSKILVTKSEPAATKAAR